MGALAERTKTGLTPKAGAPRSDGRRATCLLDESAAESGIGVAVEGEPTLDLRTAPAPFGGHRTVEDTGCRGHIVRVPMPSPLSRATKTLGG